MLGSELVGGSMVAGEVSPAESEGPATEERYRARGYAIEHADAMSDITDNETCYLVDGTLELDSVPELHDVRDIAVVGVSDDARLKIPAGHRGYALIIRSGTGFTWSGVDIDQRAYNAMGRIYAAMDAGLRIIDGKHIGVGRDEKTAIDERSIRDSGPIFYIPATSKNGVNRIHNWDLTFGGKFPTHHFGNRPMGLWTGPTHRGTIRITDSHFESIPNNAIYGSASPGRFEVENTTFRDNGVSCGGRFGHGYWKNCDIEFDYENSTLQNANAAGHGVVGMASEVKKQGANGDPGPDIIDTDVRMVNVGKGGAGIRAYDIYRRAPLGRIEGVSVSIGKGTGGYDADIEVEGPVEAIRDCTFSGSNRHYASIVNTSGEQVVVENSEWEYPASRSRDKGDVTWS